MMARPVLSDFRRLSDGRLCRFLKTISFINFSMAQIPFIQNYFSSRSIPLLPNVSLETIKLSIGFSAPIPFDRSSSFLFLIAPHRPESFHCLRSRSQLQLSSDYLSLVPAPRGGEGALKGSLKGAVLIKLVSTSKKPKICAN